MPYEDIQALPQGLKAHLPLGAQEIYREAFNLALEQYADMYGQQGSLALEEAVTRRAWAAVKQRYRLDPTTRRWRMIVA